MEHQIQRSIFTEHQLVVEGQLFVEKKETTQWSNRSESAEDLHDVVRESHSRQIGDDKFYTIHQTVDKDGKVADHTIDTNLETEEDVEAFNAEWTSGWHPTLITESSNSDGFLTSLKNSLKFW